ncbi:hypothetical protein SGODD07_01910 [Streptococcus gordonii]|uniref:Uncharacterized protein n=1 Tax=Streptococcus gordonii TaxID=1302 RepID=A0A139MZE4_STRGN|nr:hypothetical protein SGODD07_01910 [Streptococcus gordonii]
MTSSFALFFLENLDFISIYFSDFQYYFIFLESSVLTKILF